MEQMENLPMGSGERNLRLSSPASLTHNSASQSRMAHVPSPRCGQTRPASIATPPDSHSGPAACEVLAKEVTEKAGLYAAWMWLSLHTSVSRQNSHLHCPVPRPMPTGVTSERVLWLSSLCPPSRLWRWNHPGL